MRDEHIQEAVDRASSSSEWSNVSRLLRGEHGSPGGDINKLVNQLAEAFRRKIAEEAARIKGREF